MINLGFWLALSIISLMSTRLYAQHSSESVELAKTIPIADVHMHTYFRGGPTSSAILEQMDKNNVKWGGAVGDFRADVADKLKERYIPAIGQMEFMEVFFNRGPSGLIDEENSTFKRLYKNAEEQFSNGTIKDSKSVTFGMRKFSVKRTQFSINGRTTFLRGKHDAAVFPLSGYPPMNVEKWERVFKIAKSWGINHYRFHTYCPPEAAFIAANQEGIYLQVELPFWGGMESDTIAQNMKNEGIAMLKSYANHPSFVMFSPGNEIWGGHEKVEKYMLELKAYDNRPLYTMGSNNNIGYAAPKEYSDFFVGARVPDQGDTNLAHTRLTHAFADAENGGILNTQTPSTNINFFYITYFRYG